nr:hypothetical protein [Candidatus Sigynarchaeota archaeon]
MPAGFLKHLDARKLAISILAVASVACTCSAILDVAAQAPGIDAFYSSNPDGIAFQEVRVPLR